MKSSKFQKGEITTIVALGTMAFILVSTLVSSLVAKKPQTTSTKAAATMECAYESYSACYTACTSSTKYCTSTGCIAGTYQCKTRTTYPTSTTKPSSTIKPTTSSNNGSCTSCKAGCEGKSVGSSGGTTYYCCGPYKGKTSGGSCPSYYHNSVDKTCATCGTDTTSGVSSSTGCCTITSTCGSYGCPEGYRYVHKWPNVTNCTGNYVACPKFTPYANENEGCYKDDNCNSTGTGSGGCTASGLTCPNSSNTYSVIKTGTKYTYYKSSDTSCSGTTYLTYEAACDASVKPTSTPSVNVCTKAGTCPSGINQGGTVYKKNDYFYMDNCSGTQYPSLYAACHNSGGISSTSTKSAKATATPKPTNTPKVASSIKPSPTTPAACSNMTKHSCVDHCASVGKAGSNGKYYYTPDNSGLTYYDEGCSYLGLQLFSYCGCKDSPGLIDCLSYSCVKFCENRGYYTGNSNAKVYYSESTNQFYDDSKCTDPFNSEIEIEFQSCACYGSIDSDTVSTTTEATADDGTKCTIVQIKKAGNTTYGCLEKK